MGKALCRQSACLLAYEYDICREGVSHSRPQVVPGMLLLECYVCCPEVPLMRSQVAVDVFCGDAPRKESQVAFSINSHTLSLAFVATTCLTKGDKSPSRAANLPTKRYVNRAMC